MDFYLFPYNSSKDKYNLDASKSLVDNLNSFFQDMQMRTIPLDAVYIYEHSSVQAYFKTEDGEICKVVPLELYTQPLQGIGLSRGEIRYLTRLR